MLTSLIYQMKTNTKVLCVDWDDTCFEDPAYQSYGLWIPSGATNEPITRVHDFIKEKANEGYEIHVVSFREERHKQEMIDLAKLYDLPIKTFTCTSGKTKTPILKSLRCEIMIDDNVEVLVLAEQAGIKGLLVNWGQEDVNSTATLFEKI